MTFAVRFDLTRPTLAFLFLLTFHWSLLRVLNDILFGCDSKKNTIPRG